MVLVNDSMTRRLELVKTNLSSIVIIGIIESFARDDTMLDMINQNWSLLTASATTNFTLVSLTMILIGYLTITQKFRYRRKARIEAPFGPGKRELSSMTVNEAYTILAELQELEFPYAFAKARKLALLKVRIIQGVYYS